MKLGLLRRRSVWCPTLLGWAVLAVGVGVPLLFWCLQGEKFLSLTEREPADILVVEGWIGIEGVRAAKAEFEQGHYRTLITAGGMMINRWGEDHWNLAEEARLTLLRAGFPSEKVIEAPARDTATHRTFESAVAVRTALENQSSPVTRINVFTLGAHARRSRLVYAKALSPAVEVGVISWSPSSYHDEPWWHSSERAEDLIKETVGYVFEVLLNSGRTSNGTREIPPRTP